MVTTPAPDKADFTSGSPEKTDSASKFDSAASAWDFLHEAAQASVQPDAEPVVVVSHVRPDADTIGSACAVVQLIRRWGGNVVAVSGDGDLPPEMYRQLPGADAYVEVDDCPAMPAYLVAVDAASQGRCGVVSALVDQTPHTLVIDHHSTATGFGDVNWIQVGAESTTMMVAHLCEEHGEVIDKAMAAALYAGLVGDTNSFRWGGPSMFDAARKLAATGIDTRRITVSLLDDHSVDFLRLLGSVLTSLIFEPDAAGGNGLVWVLVPHEQIKNASVAETESIIDVVRWAAEADVAMVIKEFDPQEIVISLRSRGAIDVSAVAKALGGGGHTHAAGLTWHGTAADFLPRLREQLDTQAQRQRVGSADPSQPTEPTASAEPAEPAEH